MKVKYHKILEEARKNHYAVGYFECWDMESLLAVTDAAELKKSPVIIGFSGIYLPNPDRIVRNPLKFMAKIINELCEEITVPCCTVFNESPYFEEVLKAIEYGYDMVMFSNEKIGIEEYIKKTSEIVKKAHMYSVDVEGEIIPPLGIGDNLDNEANYRELTDPKTAKYFIKETNIDSLSVNIGQAHFHGRKKLNLDFDRLKLLKKNIDIPLVLHGSSSVYEEDIRLAAKKGISKVNVGSVLKQTFFKALKEACSSITDEDNPYHIIGSGLEKDVIAIARIALMEKIGEIIDLLGSNNKAKI